MKKTAIKTAAMLSGAVLLAMSGMAVSQAEDAAAPQQATSDAPVATAAMPSADAAASSQPAATSDATAPAATPESGSTADATTSTDATASTDAAAATDGAAAVAIAAPAAKADEEPIPKDTPQVQKLVALYPKLIARIEPVGKVCFEGEECDVTVRSSGASADGGPRDGKSVYDAVCHTCHATGLLGSPKLGDKGAWGARIGKGKDTLYTHAIQGFNAMPAKGGADIPDEEVQNAVDYMVEAAS